MVGKHIYRLSHQTLRTWCAQFFRNHDTGVTGIVPLMGTDIYGLRSIYQHFGSPSVILRVTIFFQARILILIIFWKIHTKSTSCAVHRKKKLSQNIFWWVFNIFHWFFFQCNEHIFNWYFQDKNHWDKISITYISVENLTLFPIVITADTSIIYGRKKIEFSRFFSLTGHEMTRGVVKGYRVRHYFI